MTDMPALQQNQGFAQTDFYIFFWFYNFIWYREANYSNMHIIQSSTCFFVLNLLLVEKKKKKITVMCFVIIFLKNVYCLFQSKMIKNDCSSYHLYLPKTFSKMCNGICHCPNFANISTFYGTNQFPKKLRFLNFPLHFDKIIVFGCK